MTSVHTATSSDVDTRGSAPGDCSARLALKPGVSARGCHDGVCWPRSADPAVGHAALIETATSQRAPVRRIALNMGGWDSAPRRSATTHPAISGRRCVALLSHGAG